MKRSIVVSTIVVTLLLLLGALASASAQTPATVTYYACVNNSTGAITIVSKTTTCKTGFHKIQWNQVGPQAPAGPQGPKGATGAQGPPGISVGNSTLGSAGSVAIFPGTLVAQTSAVQVTGNYYIAASALLYVSPSDSVYCYTTTGSNGAGVFDMQAGSGVAGYVSTAPSDAIFIGAGDVFQFYCYSKGSDTTSSVYDAALTATLINSSFAPKKSRHSPVQSSSDPTGPHASN
jgi:hypothetical protein